MSTASDVMLTPTAKVLGVIEGEVEDDRSEGRARGVNFCQTKKRSNGRRNSPSRKATSFAEKKYLYRFYGYSGRYLKVDST